MLFILQIFFIITNITINSFYIKFFWQFNFLRISYNSIHRTSWVGLHSWFLFFVDDPMPVITLFSTKHNSKSFPTNWIFTLHCKTMLLSKPWHHASSHSNTISCCLCFFTNWHKNCDFQSFRTTDSTLRINHWHSAFLDICIKALFMTVIHIFRIHYSQLKLWTNYLLRKRAFR